MFWVVSQTRYKLFGIHLSYADLVNGSKEWKSTTRAGIIIRHQCDKEKNMAFTVLFVQ